MAATTPESKLKALRGKPKFDHIVLTAIDDPDSGLRFRFVRSRSNGFTYGRAIKRAPQLRSINPSVPAQPSAKWNAQHILVLLGRFIRESIPRSVTNKTTYLAVILALTLTGCRPGKASGSYGVSTSGDPIRGKELIRQYGCGACHIVPGVQNARGLVGPPLLYFSQRTMIAGELPNSPSNLVRWIQHPRQVEPNTAMPDLGLTEDQAIDVAAYLFTLRGPEGA